MYLQFYQLKQISKKRAFQSLIQMLLVVKCLLIPFFPYNPKDAQWSRSLNLLASFTHKRSIPP